MQKTVLTLGLSYPESVAVDGAGSVYVADSSHNRVVKRPTGGPATTLGFTGLSAPEGLAVDTGGTVFATSYSNSQVLKLTSAGIQTTLGLTGLDHPGGLAVDTGGNVYVADTYNGRVVKLTSGGAQSTIGFSGLSYPRGVAVDTAGTVYVADTGTGSVVKRTSGGTQSTVVSGLSYPSKVAVDTAGNVFVANASQVIEIFAGGGSTSLAFTGLNVTHGVAVDGAGNVYASDMNNGRVVELPSGGSQTTLDFGDLGEPAGVAADAAGNAYVPDSQHDQVLELPSAGGRTTLGFTDVSGPQGVAVDTAGDVFVSGCCGYVAKLPKGGSQVDINPYVIGSPALAVNGAGDVYVYGDNYYSGTEHWQLAKRPAAGGAWVNIASGLTSSPGYGVGVAVDGAGTSYASTSGVVRRYPTSGSPTTLPLTGLLGPKGIAIDAAGNVYVVDSGNSRVLRLTPGGVQTTLPFSGLVNPIGVAVDGSGNVFVTNQGPAGALLELSPGAPGAPTIVTATRGNAQVQLTWSAPASDGGSAITGYVVTPFIGAAAQTPVTFDSTATTQTITGLVNGTSYTFEVAAKNVVGTGPQSAASSPVTPATVPGAPTIGTATPGDAQAQLTWTAPASNGGSAITGYVVTPFIGAAAQAPVTFNSASTAQTITGLANRSTYTFKVAAKNAVGTGAQSSASNAVTPLGPYHPFTSWSTFVTRQFTDLTAKAPTSSQLSTWSTNLGNGSKTKGDLIEGLRRGTDNTTNVDPAARLYRAFLGRTPDASGLRFWVNRRRTGAWTLVRIADYFASSSEFQRKYGTLTNRQFVTRIYTDVLERAADPAGVDYWTRQLDFRRRTRGSVMVGFSESSEYKRKQAENTDVAVAYIYLMGRAPTAGEVSDWVSRQKAGTSQAALATELLDSPGYITHILG